ncbi:hypothetical protein [Winogradskyella alexanderae]|uniref:CdiI immunity protein domain-containing protein n=1 Tax=Winogradskyella alexanderae TaxID=2877123 RepID=A0ABS7XV99_9FLAO|nr:hypothetical protein [Winogradskyella alexanderae]MCA0133951.1 hypothetical protein [Winogradskyella alexanderae]
MTNKEVKTLEHFFDRTFMWIHPIDRNTITSFIHGFEAGSDNKFFTTLLKKHLESEYNIFGSNQGWPNQVRLYAEKKEIDWNEAFFELGKTIISELKKL